MGVAIPIEAGALQINLLSLTWWNRLEPRPRSPEVADTLAAKIRDPLWMLTRQWQFGEFQGEDAGSPAWVQMRARTTPFLGWRPHLDTGQPLPLRPITAPLEELVETEAFAPDLATQAEWGLTLASLLEDQGLNPTQRAAVLAAVREEFPLDSSRVDPSDARAARFLGVCDGRAVNGVELAAQGATPALLAKPAVVPFVAQLQAAITALQQSISRTLGQIGADSGTSWHSDRLEYQVEAVAAGPTGGTMLFQSTPDRDATFEWFTMDLLSRAENPGTPEGVAVPVPEAMSVSRLPTFVRFRGMPNHRWWDFERGSSDFGSVIPDKRDLAKLLVMDFMLIHGNDYFVVPFDFPVSRVARIDELLVHDVFGGVTLVDRADAAPTPPDARWTCFSTSIADQDGRPADFLLLPPSAGPARLVGDQIEDVRFVRDEQANLVWAIEQMIEGGEGRPWPGRERHVAASALEPPQVVPVTTAPLLYRLQSFVPWHWFPMLPVSLDQFTGETALERGQMIRPDGITSPAPIGRLIQAPPNGVYRVREEAVPRTGLKVVREVVRCRWLSGETHLWIARRKGVGRGEGSSGLRYDEARRTPPPAE